MPRLDPVTRNIAIDRLQAGESQNEVARTLNVNQSTISRQWNRFQHNWFNEWSHSYSWARSVHPGLSSTESNRCCINHCNRIPKLRRISSQTFRNRFRQHGIRPRRPLVQQIKMLHITKLANNLVKRRVSFSSADIRVHRHRNERFSSSCGQEVDSFGWSSVSIDHKTDLVHVPCNLTL